MKYKYEYLFNIDKFFSFSLLNSFREKDSCMASARNFVLAYENALSAGAI